ncbi:MAG: hypothetical protein PHP08_04720 [Candidatus Dojkabacteria bacterium]|nr:hypothetical protein [Candidatus Dojkabacteria bacterium]
MYLASIKYFEKIEIAAGSWRGATINPRVGYRYTNKRALNNVISIKSCFDRITKEYSFLLIISLIDRYRKRIRVRMGKILTILDDIGTFNNVVMNKKKNQIEKPTTKEVTKIVRKSFRSLRT